MMRDTPHAAAAAAALVTAILLIDGVSSLGAPRGSDAAQAAAPAATHEPVPATEPTAGYAMTRVLGLCELLPSPFENGATHVAGVPAAARSQGRWGLST